MIVGSAVAADRFVIAVVAVAVAAAAAAAAVDLSAAADLSAVADPSPAGLGLSFGPFCSADFFAAVAAAVSDASSAAQFFS